MNIKYADTAYKETAMNHEQIKTFLAAAQKGSLRGAAEDLYVEQGTVSRRIAELEHELHVTLFYRQKGNRNTSLSEHGEMFLPIARQISSLYEEAMKLHEKDPVKQLRVAGTYSLTDEFLMPVYREYLRKYPETELITGCEHSSEIYSMVESMRADIGLVTSIHSNPNVISELLNTEPFVLMYHRTSAYALSGRKEDLKDQDEIYAAYSADYETWHGNAFSGSRRCRITAGSLSMCIRMLETDHSVWIILPEHTAVQWTAMHPDWIFEKTEGAPERTIWLLTGRNRRPAAVSAAEDFRRLMDVYLRTMKAR